jgi:16S rRNA (uracil1498-N3)-methyltransferase
MQLFYIPDIQGNSITLDREESRHCLRVLRYREGSVIRITDGKGNMMDGKIVIADPDGCQVDIIRRQLIPRYYDPLHIAIAPTKNPDRLEWFMEKVTEIGIEEVTPLICEHAERTTVKVSRLQKIMVSAVKQSLKAWAPIIHEPTDFRDFIAKPFEGQKFIAYCETGKESMLFREFKPSMPTLVLIGPEGDFSPKEVAQAMDHGFIPVSLGPSRLRTETAGVVVCQTVRVLEGKVKSEE